MEDMEKLIDLCLCSVSIIIGCHAISFPTPPYQKYQAIRKSSIQKQSTKMTYNQAKQVMSFVFSN
jgi:hypothetical protein